MPSELLPGMANQRRPFASKARKSGWTYFLGNWMVAIQPDVEGSNSSILPAGVPGGQVGCGSQPGTATQTCPLLSKAVPQGSVPAGRYQSCEVRGGLSAKTAWPIPRKRVPTTLAANTTRASDRFVPRINKGFPGTIVTVTTPGTR